MAARNVSVCLHYLNNLTRHRHNQLSFYSTLSSTHTHTCTHAHTPSPLNLLHLCMLSGRRGQSRLSFAVLMSNSAVFQPADLPCVAERCIQSGAAGEATSHRLAALQNGSSGAAVLFLSPVSLCHRPLHSLPLTSDGFGQA